LADLRFPNTPDRSRLPRWLLPAGVALIVAIAIATPWAKLTGAAHRLKGDALADGPAWLQDRKLAFESYRMAAEHGDAEAQVRLGEILIDGEWAEDGIPQDDTAALHWFQMAADQDNPDGQSWIGWMHDEGRATREDDALALQWYTKSAEQDDHWAQAQLGLMYEAGIGTNKDIATAMRWYRRAAESGDAYAQVRLGKIFLTTEPKREGVTKNDSAALSWFRRAAEQGDADGEGWVGWMYATGRGVDMDEQEAVRWYALAAQQADAWAQAELGWMYHKGLGVAADDVEAARLYHLASEQDDAWAQYRLGWLYAHGRGVPQDHAEALRLLRAAAEGELVEAQIALGDVYRTGRLGVAIDVGLAVDWYRRAAENEGHDGAAPLAEMYLDGLGVAQDSAQAAQLAEGQARHGDPRAQFVVGRIQAEGLLGRVDRTSAYVWFSMSAAFGFEPAAQEREELVSTMTPSEIADAEAQFRSSARDLALSDSARERFEEYRSASSIGAYAIGPRGSGWTEGYESARAAADAAMVQCEKRRIEDDLPCRLFAVGPQIVFGLPEAEVDRIIGSFGSTARH
jgi:TPR repeat protein